MLSLPVLRLARSEHPLAAAAQRHVEVVGTGRKQLAGFGIERGVVGGHGGIVSPAWLYFLADSFEAAAGFPGSSTAMWLRPHGPPASFSFHPFGFG